MERPLEDFLAMQSQWGVPMPATPPGFGASSLFAPAMSGLGLAPGITPMLPPPMLPEMPAVEEEAPVEETGFAAAPFAPPRMMERPANQDVFGDWLSRLGIARPTTPPGASPPGMPQPQQTTDPRLLRAQPTTMPRGPVAPVAKPTYRPSPALAHRYPGASRLAPLLDRARERRGWV